MKEKFIIAIDQSTTGTKALLINHAGAVINKCYLEHRQIFPNIGWVEHDPLELLNNVKKLISNILSESGKTARDIECISITNQRETVLAWDKKSGLPVYNAIVWQCNRAEPQCERIRSGGLEHIVKERTGLPLSEYFSAAKLAWIMDNVDKARSLRDAGELLCGTVDSWLVWNLSKEKNHITDYSNASRTQLFSLKKLCWDEEIAKAFGLTLEMLPKTVCSDTVVGHYVIDSVEIPIAGIIGDSHGALFSQCGFENGLKVTYGTGSSIMLGTGKNMYESENLATTVSYALNNQVNFAIEGNIISTGATVKWVADKLQLMKAAGEAETFATEIDGNGGVYFVPAFDGLGAPYWAPKAKAVIYGLSFDSDSRNVIRAALESIAYQISDVVFELERSTNHKIESLMVDGKPTENNFLMEFQADITSKTIVKNNIIEASAYGSALMAGLATGFWSRVDIKGLITHDEVIKPEMPEGERKALLAGWHKAVRLSVSD